MENSFITALENPQGTVVASVVTAQKYTVSSSGKCEMIEGEKALQEDFLYYEDIAYPGKYKPSLLKRDVDLYGWRSFTDLVIQGTARTDTPTTSLEIRLSCTGRKVSYERVILATGDRYVEKGASGRAHLTDPVPFTEMPVRYDKAYGGTDELAESKDIDEEELQTTRTACGEKEDLQVSAYSYPRNPAGKGYLVYPEGMNGLAWPNLEFPEELVNLDELAAPLNAWGKRPYPACFDWVPHLWFPRFALFCLFVPPYDMVSYAQPEDGLVPEPEVRMGILEKDAFKKSVDKRQKNHDFAQGAHPYLRHRLNGNEKIRVTAMSPDGRPFLAALPGRPPKITMRLFSHKPEPAEAMLDLVFIETEKMQLTLVWRGSLPLEGKRLTPDLGKKLEKECEYQVIP